MMTHDELLAKLDYDGIKPRQFSIPRSYSAVFALRAVVEFHRPLGVVNGNPNKLVCACGEYMYPCPTIQAIEVAIARGQK